MSYTSDKKYGRRGGRYVEPGEAGEDRMESYRRERMAKVRAGLWPEGVGGENGYGMARQRELAAEADRLQATRVPALAHASRSPRSGRRREGRHQGPSKGSRLMATIYVCDRCGTDAPEVPGQRPGESNLPDRWVYRYLPDTTEARMRPEVVREDRRQLLCLVCDGELRSWAEHPIDRTRQRVADLLLGTFDAIPSTAIPLSGPPPDDGMWIDGDVLYIRTHWAPESWAGVRIAHSLFPAVDGSEVG